jgi:hypothetical protein
MSKGTRKISSSRSGKVVPAPSKAQVKSLAISEDDAGFGEKLAAQRVDKALAKELKAQAKLGLSITYAVGSQIVVESSGGKKIVIGKIKPPYSRGAFLKSAKVRKLPA